MGLARACNARTQAKRPSLAHARDESRSLPSMLSVLRSGTGQLKGSAGSGVVWHGPGVRFKQGSGVSGGHKGLEGARSGGAGVVLFTPDVRLTERDSEWPVEQGLRRLQASRSLGLLSQPEGSEFS